MRCVTQGPDLRSERMTNNPQPEKIKPLENAYLFCHDICPKPGSNRCQPHPGKAGEARYEQQRSASGQKVPGKVGDEPVHRLPAALSTVLGAIYPVAGPLLWPGGKVWGIGIIVNGSIGRLIAHRHL
jgi:hypothetical protein